MPTRSEISNLTRRLVLPAALITLAMPAVASGTLSMSTAPSAAARHPAITDGNESSFGGGVSADGRYVVFESRASNLVPGDTNASADVFVRDRVAGMTERVSVSSKGVEGNGASNAASISGDGRYVAFTSWATNLVSNDTNRAADIFIHDRLTGRTRRVSVSSNGAQANRATFASVISADGRVVAFDSGATNLVPGDTNRRGDVFVRNVISGVTRRVSVSSSERQGNGTSSSVVLASDGHIVAFRSYASNLVPGDTNRQTDVFVRNREKGRTTRVSVSSTGRQPADASRWPAISGNGRIVAFVSEAAILVPRDTNRRLDVFVHNRRTGTTRRVSVSSTGRQANGDNYTPLLSGSGHLVAFESGASDLAPNDTNGVDDVFVHDRVTGKTTLASVASTGQEGSSVSIIGGLSGDGRYVVFSTASPLDPSDANGYFDAYIRNLTTGVTERVSVGP